jgi:hypothetical protein
MPTPLEKGADVRFIGPVMGRYTLESRIRPSGVQIFAIRLQSISPALLVASAPVPGRVGEVVTAHFVPFGNVRGRVARHIDGGFVIDIEGDYARRRKLAARIEWYKKRVFSGVTDKREHKRFMPREPKSAVVLADGTVLPCLVIDLSSSGAAISVDHSPQVGDPLALGTALCRVVRRLDVGFAVQFLTPIDHQEVEEAVRAPEDWERAGGPRPAEASAGAFVDVPFAIEDANYAI